MSGVAASVALVAAMLGGSVAFAATADATAVLVPATAAQEAWSTCVSPLCIDAPPPTGSSGWGWTTTNKKSVTTLTVGTPAPFVVNQISANGGHTGPGTITITYTTTVFTLATTDSRKVTGTDPYGTTRGGVLVFTEADSYWSHGATGDTFTFTPKKATTEALVTVTIDVTGKQASETFPVTV
ncbi:MAG: hypothetical protein ACRDV4_10185, partial [Acidimicrobiales bacterium]